MEAQDRFRNKVTGKDGTAVQVEISFVWDDQPGGAVRILAAIADGGFRSFIPWTHSAQVKQPETSIEADQSPGHS